MTQGRLSITEKRQMAQDRAGFVLRHLPPHRSLSPALRHLPPHHRLRYSEAVHPSIFLNTLLK